MPPPAREGRRGDDLYGMSGKEFLRCLFQKPRRLLVAVFYGGVPAARPFRISSNANPAHQIH